LHLILRSARRRLETAAAVALAAALVTASAFLIAPHDAAAAGTGSQISAAATSLGLPTTINLSQAPSESASASSVTYSISVPSGLRPATLVGTLQAQSNPGSGYLEIESSAGTVLSLVRLPDTSRATRNVSFTVPLGALQTVDGTAQISFALSGTKTVDCNSIQVAVSPTRVDFTGTPLAPHTVDKFFTKGLQRVSIYTDATPTAAEEQATLELTQSLISNYGVASIDVRALSGSGAPPAPASAFGRTVVIRQAGAPGVSVVPAVGGGSVLLLSGGASSLPKQAKLFAASLAQLAHAGTAVVLRPGAVPRATATNSYTFGQLGLSALASVYGERTLTLTLNVGQLGGSLRGLTVHLIGGYTPIGPPGQGTLTATVGSVPLANLRLNGSGRLNTGFSIPHQLISGATKVALTVTYSPEIQCLPATPSMTFGLFPSSYITVDRPATQLGGFLSLPGAFAHGIDVALQNNAIAELDAAAKTIVGMQGPAGVALTPHLIPFGQAASNRVGTLIVADGAGVKSLGLDPPLQESGAQISASFPGNPRIGLRGGFAALESFADPPHGRIVLLVTATRAWAALTPLFSGISAKGWSSLTGDTYASVAGGRPTNLTIRTSGISTFTPPPPPSSSWQIIFIVVGLAALGILAFMIGRWQVARRRRRP
jgi:hypothetical protein